MFFLPSACRTNCNTYSISRACRRIHAKQNYFDKAKLLQTPFTPIYTHPPGPHPPDPASSSCSFPLSTAGRRKWKFPNKKQKKLSPVFDTTTAAARQAGAPQNCPSVTPVTTAPPPTVLTLQHPEHPPHPLLPDSPQHTATRQTGDRKQLINVLTPLHLPGPTRGGELSA